MSERDELYTLTRYILPLLVVIAIVVNVRHAYSMTVLPPYPLQYSPDCYKTTFGSWQRQTCWLYGKEYTPSAGAPVAMIAPQVAGKYPVVIWRHGYTGYPITCNNDNQSRTGTIVIKPCAIWYPNQNDYPPWRLNWGGPWEGKNPEGLQAGEALEEAYRLFNVDHGAGVTLEGTSEGGSWAIIQSMIAPEFLRTQISVVDATLPHTLIVKTTRDPSVFKAWGNFDLSLMDFRVQSASGKLDNIFYRIRGATNDSLGVVDLEFFRLADQYKIAAFGTWDACGHSTACNDWPRETFQGESVVRRDKVFPVFTNSTANNWGASGHYNLGLSWSGRNVRDTAEGVTLPIRYLKRAASQPDAAGFSVTVRPKNFRLTVGVAIQWRIGEQSGSGVVVKAGEFTAENITLNSGEVYQSLYIWSA